MKIYLDTVGCRLNQAEIEIIASQFRQAGHEIVATPRQADLAVVNTCTVTAAAASDSRSLVRRLNRKGIQNIVLTGCWSTLEPDYAAGLPGVTHLIPNDLKDHLAAEVLSLPHEYFSLEPPARQPLPGSRSRTRAFIKVQDGCNNACAFCVTTLARGPARSLSDATILAAVKAALAGGTREIVLTGVHLGAWGQDLTPPRRLSHLISFLLANADLPRLRLSSLEPWDLDEEFFSLWSHPALCRHLHLPLQSGSPSVLKRMNRKTTPAEFASLVEVARRLIPNVAVTTDVIVGFPGETDADYKQTLDFVRSLQLAGGHVFTFSSRPGTPAAGMDAPVRLDLAKWRNKTLQRLFQESASAYRKQFVGQTMSVLWESAAQWGPHRWKLQGLTDNYLRVSTSAPEMRWNEIQDVRLTTLESDGLSGEIVTPPA